MMPVAKKPKLEADKLIKQIPPPPAYDPLPFRQLARAGIPQLPAGLLNTDPYSLFTLFLTEQDFETIARNTNLYAKARDAGKAGKKPWWPTSAPEVKVFIGIFIYMGVVRLPSIEDYWSERLGLFLYSRHMSLCRFEALKRFFHVSPPTPAESKEDRSEDEAPKKSIGWWYRLEPVASNFRSRCAQL